MRVTSRVLKRARSFASATTSGLAMTSLWSLVAVAQVPPRHESSGPAEAASGQERAGAPDATRRAAEDLARDASQAFDRYQQGKPIAEGVPRSPVRTAQARTPPVGVTGESGSDWLQRSRRSYGALIERLAEPTAPNPVQDAARRQALERAGLWERTGERQTADGKSSVVVMAPGTDRPASAPAAEPDLAPAKAWLDREVDRVAGVVRNEVMGKLAEAGTPTVSGAQGPATPSSASPVSEGWLAWLNQGFGEFQRDVVGKLATPIEAPMPAADGQAMARSSVPQSEPAATSVAPSRMPQPPPSPGGQAERDAEAPARTAIGVGIASHEPEVPAKRAEPDQSAAIKAKETANARLVEEQRVQAERRTVEAARRAEMVRKAEAERQSAERKAADAARVADARAAEVAQKAEAERQSAERKAADAARVADARAAEVAQKAEAERQSAERKAADAARVADARAAEVARKAELSRLAADRQYTARAQADTVARTQADKLAETRRATTSAAAEVARQAGQAAEKAGLEAHRLSGAWKLAQQQVDAARASQSATVPLPSRPAGEVSGLGLSGAKAEDHGQKLAEAVRASAMARQTAEAARRTEFRIRREADRARMASEAAETARQVVETAPDDRARSLAATRLAVSARQASNAAARALAIGLPRALRVAPPATKAQPPKRTLAVASVQLRPDGSAIVAPLPIRRPTASLSVGKSRGQRGHCVSAGRTITPPGWYVVARSDTLSQISARHYHTALGSRRILQSNKRQIRRAGVIRPCQRLYLPK